MLEHSSDDLTGSPAVSRWAEAVCSGSSGRCGLASAPAAARAFLVAALAAHARWPMLVVCQRFRDMDELAAGLDMWLGEGSSLLFPPFELAAAGTAPDPEIVAQRLATLKVLAAGSGAQAAGRRAPIVVTTGEATQQRVPSPEALGKSALDVRVGATLGFETLPARLSEAGYLRVSQVDDRGQFSVRGGVLDVFSLDSRRPFRVEFFGDIVHSIREFAIEDQLTRRIVEEAAILLDAGSEEDSGKLGDWFSAGCLTVDCCESDESDGPAPPECFEHDFLRTAGDDTLLQEQHRALLLRHLADWQKDGFRTVVFCNNEGERQRLSEILSAQTAEAGAVRVEFRIGHLPAGFALPEDRLAILSDAEIFGRYRNVQPWRARDGRGGRAGGGVAGDFESWKEGDYLVHAQQGIARYLGLHPVNLGGARDEEVLVLEFADAAKLYVPLEQAHLVSRYVGLGRRKPELDVLGGSRWERARLRAHRAILDYAATMLRLNAEREVLPGHRFPPDSEWQREFEAAFLYQPTADQVRAIAETKADMESSKPMDRLVCGDVGFGKTEVAIRAVFKAVMAGKQAAFLCPTTVLAQQHFTTLRERMADYPVRIEALSRFLSASAQNRVVRAVAAGEVDVLIGTHRLLSPDVVFKDIGLLVVDEEQRFGVRHKEMLKERFRSIDILTLSATPIPRTLYLALMGARDMSTIETPPAGRIPIETAVIGYDERVIREAIRRELARDGQVFYLHNRIASIDRVAARIQELVPGLRVAVGHGRMPDDELEEVMMSFVEGKADVLVSTTIVESGLDIPNANTIIIDRADRFGMADLYQLRGRVGRGQHKAYAYLLLPPALMATAEARRRTSAIRQYSQLGAGFKIAMRDLEIRGAGNLLGTEQSGHVTAIGFDLYCKLLRQAVQQMKSGRPAIRRDVPVHVDFLALNEARVEEGRLAAYLPARFLRDPVLRIAAYREVAEVTNLTELENLASRWRDWFGVLPDEAENLLLYHRIKLLAAERRVRDIEVAADQVRIRKGDDFVMIGTRFPRLVSKEPRERLSEVLRLVESLA